MNESDYKRIGTGLQRTRYLLERSFGGLRPRTGTVVRVIPKLRVRPDGQTDQATALVDHTVSRSMGVPPIHPFRVAASSHPAIP